MFWTELTSESMAKGVSLRKLAAEVGLHSSTVSRALSGHPAISEATVRKVEAAAKKMGYMPNPDVRIAMSSIRRATENSLNGIFALLNFHPLEAPIQKELRQGRLYQGILRRAEALGWKADEIEMRAAGMTTKRLRSILEARNINGVILLPQALNEPVPKMDLGDLRVVATSATWNTVPWFEKIPAVLPAHWRNAQVIFEHIKKQGYKRPLLVIHDGIEDRHMHATEAAFLLSQQRGDWEANLPILYDMNRKNIRALADKHQPDVIVGPDVFIKHSIENDLKLHCPKDCACLTYARVDPSVTGFDQRWDLIGESAVDWLTGMLIQRASQNNDAQRVLLVQGKVREGPTLPRRKKKAGPKK